jgi:hypothetical protein
VKTTDEGGKVMVSSTFGFCYEQNSNWRNAPSSVMNITSVSSLPQFFMEFLYKFVPQYVITIC